MIHSDYILNTSEVIMDKKEPLFVLNKFNFCFTTLDSKLTLDITVLFSEIVSLFEKLIFIENDYTMKTMDNLS